MPRLPLSATLALLAACGTGSNGEPSSVAYAGFGVGPVTPVDSPFASPPETSGQSQDPQGREALSGELAVRRAGCVRCHAVPKPLAARTAPLAGPPLADASAWHVRDGAAAYLRSHHGGDDAGDLAAWLLDLGGDVELQPAATSEGTIRLGAELFHQRACGACHAPDALKKLATRTDHAHVMAFLLEPGARRPGVPHDFGLGKKEASALAAWMLQVQVRDADDDGAEVPGFGFECFEMKTNGKVPDLEGVEVAAAGVVDVIDVKPATRGNNFALRFRASLDVPAAGEWRFTTGSDDGSWLWIDGKRVVTNSGNHPYQKQSGAVELAAGPHDLEVVFTQAGGGKQLDVWWSGPGVEEQILPAARAEARAMALVPPPRAALPAAAAVARGRAAAHARQCAACHEIADDQLAAMPAAKAAPAWSELRLGRACPTTPAAKALHGAATVSLAQSLDGQAQLELMLLQDGCLSCHVRDGRGGLAPAVTKHLEEREDLGEEGRIPPDLSQVGARLRAKWIERVLTEGHRVRPYLSIRMPKVAADRAARYAELFGDVDAPGVVDDEPTFSVANAERGHALAGLEGKNCVQCHTFAGAPSLGPQGMDLSIQHERVRPAWFRNWLLNAPTLRPGTRMPSFWPLKRAADLAEIDALRTWLSLGAAAPTPAGLVPAEGSLVLLPSGRPTFHGAFLDGVSARCIAVGTAQRTHYAFDVESGRLVWLWRGDFLDATGTWHGRAGKLLKPLGPQDEWIVLEDFVLEAGDRMVAGHRVTDDGFPTFMVVAADDSCAFDDTARARLVAGGSEIVRTIRCRKGAMDIAWTKNEGVTLLVDGRPAPARSQLTAGQQVEVVYQW